MLYYEAIDSAIIKIMLLNNSSEKIYWNINNNLIVINIGLDYWGNDVICWI